MKRSFRSLAIWIALAATAVATVFAPPSSQDVVASADAMRKAGYTPQVESGRADPDRVLELEPRDLSDAPSDSFSSTLWPAPRVASVRKPSATPPPPAGPAAAPTAPPLPFRVMGRYVANGESTVFMQYNERTVAATEGMVIDDRYRVEKISGTAIELMYVPLNERQVLALSSAN